MKRLLLVSVASAAGIMAWRRRGHLMSFGARRLAAAVSDPLKKRGLKIRIPVERGGWIRTTLTADLGLALSGVVGYPLEAAAHSHFGGFNLSHVYSDFMNPDSGYYQAWVGAYVVFDSAERRHFGFDDEGQPVQQDAFDVLEADQRMVLGGAGCPHWFPDGRRVKLLNDLSTTEVESAEGASWWKLEGEADTWSAYHRGSAPAGDRRAEVVYGRVPAGAAHPLDDFHPLTYTGSFWQRYVPEWRATIAKFYICPRYLTRDGRAMTGSRPLVEECERTVQAISFAMDGMPVPQARSPDVVSARDARLALFPRR